MNQIYAIKFNLESSSHQPDIVQLFKSSGDEIIQTSDGLCLKTRKNESEIKQQLSDKSFSSGITVEKMSAETIGASTPNVQAFAKA